MRTWPRSAASGIYEDRMQLLERGCSYLNSAAYNIVKDKPSDFMRKHRYFDMVIFLLQSQSTIYCAIPKVATKTLLTVMHYVHYRDVSNHINTNWINVDIYRARIEQHANISVLVNEVRQIGIEISKTKEPLSLASFIQMYLDLLQYGRIDDVSPVKPVNPWRVGPENMFPYLVLKSLSNFSDVFSPSYTRFLFVRHPFERLASAYKERIATLEKDRVWPEHTYDNLRKQICVRHLRRGSHKILLMRKQCEEVIPSFEQFLRYILINTNTPDGISRMDFHWQPYSTICQVCKLKYNFIGKYETFDEDVKYLLKRFNLSDWNFGKQRNNESSYSTWKYQQMYSSLPNDLICQLKYLYAGDFYLFNYRFEDYINRPKLVCTLNSKIKNPDW
ncbi:unnamed protein product [Rotaria sp. Silwood1]|nr:unnamed protein product [Rotaria sp. Silwood1]